MTLYTHCKGNHQDKGKRIEATVRVAALARYIVTDFCVAGASTGWRLMPRSYNTLAGLLRAAQKYGIRVDHQSIGI